MPEKTCVSSIDIARELIRQPRSWVLFVCMQKVDPRAAQDSGDEQNKRPHFERWSRRLSKYRYGTSCWRCKTKKPRTRGLLPEDIFYFVISLKRDAGGWSRYTRITALAVVFLYVTWTVMSYNTSTLFWLLVWTFWKWRQIAFYPSAPYDSYNNLYINCWSRWGNIF
jgi:hypothetical protein